MYSKTVLIVPSFWRSIERRHAPSVGSIWQVPLLRQSRLSVQLHQRSSRSALVSELTGRYRRRRRRLTLDRVDSSLEEIRLGKKDESCEHHGCA